jgi:hypothetical protein
MVAMKALGVAASILAVLVVVPVTGASDNYQDAAGDAKGAPDIRSLYLQDNYLGKKGYMAFLAGIAPGSGTLTLDIDADNKATTGGPGGSDYRLDFNLTSETGRFLRWNGSRFFAARTPLVEIQFRGEPSVNLYARAIGNPKKFRLWLTSRRGAGRDRAPNRGYWIHELPT